MIRFAPRCTCFAMTLPTRLAVGYRTISLLMSLLLVVCLGIAPRTAQGAATRLEGISVEYGRNTVRIVVRSETNWDFSRLIVMIDSDDNPDTGFISTYRPALGFDLLIQDVTLHRFNSRQRDQWAWQSLGQANRKLASRRVIFELDAKLFRSRNPRVVAMAMSDDWQIAHDVVPREDLTLEVPDDEPARNNDNADGNAGDPSPDNAPAVEQTPMAAPRDDKSPVRHRIRGIRNFVCYYGPDQIEKAAHYDLAILHPSTQTPHQIDALKKQGTIAIGYLSVGEDDVLRLGNGGGPGQYASWYFDRDGDDRPDRNVVWKSYYANPGDRNWRKDRIDRAREIINGMGFQGLFLDTIDTVDLYADAREGMIDLIRELRREFPHVVIVLNNGFTVLPYVAAMADGMMIESFTCSYDRERQSYFERSLQATQWLDRTVEEKVRPMVTRYGFPVLALDYCRPDQSELIQKGRERADKFGFVHAVAPHKLDEIYEIPPAVPNDSSGASPADSPQEATRNRSRPRDVTNPGR